MLTAEKKKLAEMSKIFITRALVLAGGSGWQWMAVSGFIGTSNLSATLIWSTE